MKQLDMEEAFSLYNDFGWSHSHLGILRTKVQASPRLSGVSAGEHYSMHDEQVIRY